MPEIDPRLLEWLDNLPGDFEIWRVLEDIKSGAWFEQHRRERLRKRDEMLKEVDNLQEQINQINKDFPE